MYDELTQVDIDKMKAELEHRRLELRPKLIEDVQTARAFGDVVRGKLTGRGTRVAAFSIEDDGEVERPDPGGETGPGPRHEGDGTGGLEHGAHQARLVAEDEDAARAVAALRVAQGLAERRAPDPGARRREPPQRLVPRQVGRLQARVVERRAAHSVLRAWSISRTGMPSRTGYARAQS